VITVGVDLAAEPRNTAVAVLEWTGGRAAARSVQCDADDDRIVELCADADKIGIDCPLGWPEAFVDFVAAHSAMQPVAPAGTIAQRRQLVYRLTDRRLVAEPLGMRPLSVSADRIAHAAFRAAALLPAIEAALDRSGLGRIVEVYPAASLRVWRLPYRGYKGSAGREQREVLVSALCDVIDFGHFRQRCLTSDHALDAVIAAMSARAAALRCATLLTGNDIAIARVEGWIALPTCELRDLANRADGPAAKA
jgi:predicted nuclease with RNAse H fold